jgi:cell division protein FtsB
MTKTKKRKFSLGLLLVTTAVFLGLVQLVISHRLATAGEKVRQLEARAAQLQTGNSILEEEISRLGSLAAISERAAAQGFVKVTEVAYFTAPLPVAMGAVDPAVR